jgi:hypothetical protein
MSNGGSVRVQLLQGPYINFAALKCCDPFRRRPRG